MEERLYDLIFICRPDTPEADIDKVITTLEHVAAEKGGKIDSVNKWGRKRMAYRVHKLMPLARREPKSTTTSPLLRLLP